MLFNPGEFLEQSLQIGKWFALAVFVLTFAAHLSMGETNTWLRDILPIVVVCSLLLMIIGFIVPPTVNGKMKERECRALGGEWYLFITKEKEEYGCRKEYWVTGPDESDPSKTIQEKKFKRVYPENP